MGRLPSRPAWHSGWVLCVACPPLPLSPPSAQVHAPIAAPCCQAIINRDAPLLQNFLRDLLKEAKINDISEDKLIEYTDTMVTYQSFH